MRKLVILVAFLLPTIFCSRAQDILFFDNFSQYVKRGIYEYTIPALKQKGLDIAVLENKKVPKNFLIRWADFPADGDFYSTDYGFCVASREGEISLLAPTFYLNGFDIKVKLTCAVPGDGVASTVSLDGVEYGLGKPGEFQFRKIELQPGETATCEFTVHMMDGYFRFRPKITIHGQVVLYEMEISSMPAQQNFVIVEGEIVERSILPDARQSDYPDCRYTAEFSGNSIIAGAEMSQNTALVIDGFANYRNLPLATLHKGDKIRCLLIPFDELPDEAKTTQQADDLNLFLLDNYFLVSALKIDKYLDPEPSTPISGIMFSDYDNTQEDYVSIYDRAINPPLPQTIVTAQKEAISAELAEMNSLLNGIEERSVELNRDFSKAWEQEKAKDKNGFNRINGFVWRNEDNSFWCLPENYKLIDNKTLNPVDQDKIEALVALNDLLEANGCSLIVVPVPDLHAIAARVINPEFKNVPDFQTAMVVKQLSEAGIEAIYSSEELIKNHSRHNYAFFFPDNSHPHDTVQEINAELVAERLKRYNFSETLDKTLFRVESANSYLYESPDFRLPENCDIGGNTPGISLPCKEIMYDGEMVTSDHNSPIIVIGNSFIKTPTIDQDSFSAWLSCKTGCGIMSYRVFGNGPMTVILQNIFAQPEQFLKDRKVMILYLGVEHFFAKIAWNNLREMDYQQTLMNGRTLVETYYARNNGFDNEKNKLKAQYSRYAPGWAGLNEKSEIFFPNNESQEIIEIDAAANLDKDKKAVGIIRCALFSPNTEAEISINGTWYAVPVSPYLVNDMNRWQNIIFELPAGTEKMIIEAKGRPGALLGIKDIRIYQ